jgi:peptide/nickel transport system substrate-binding protein/oligopeptide transport system substrate-binding protein
LSALTYPTSWAVPQALIERYFQPGYSPSPPAWTKHLLDDGPFGGNPYLLTKWQDISSTDRASLIFERNERFLGKKPALRRIEYSLYKDVAVEWSDLTQDKGDVASILPAQYATTRALKGVTVQQTPMLSYWSLKPNWQFAPFDDVRVRQGFSLALDRNALILKGFGSAQPDLPPETIRAYRQPTIHLVPEGMPGYNPALADAAGRTGMEALTPDLDAAHTGQRLRRREM